MFFRNKDKDKECMIFKNQRNEEVTDEGHEAFKVKESVNYIIRAFDPEHELSEAKDTLKDKLEIDTINHNDEGITQQLKFTFKGQIMFLMHILFNVASTLN